MIVGPVAPSPYAAAAASAPQAAKPPAEGFGQSLASAVGQVEAQHASADDALTKLASGEEVDLHGTMIALEKADIALRTMVSVRDRVVSAYEQVMNMAI